MATSLIHRSIQSSELSRNPASVFAEAEHGPVAITRRDGEDFVLTTARRAEEERRAFAIGADLVAASVSSTGGSLVERLRGPFPWLEFLSPTSRERFAVEIIDVTRACAAVGQFDRLLSTLAAWQASAEAIASGYTLDGDLEWLDEPPLVDDPREPA